MTEKPVGMWRSSVTEADDKTIDFVRMGAAFAVIGAGLSIPIFVALFTTCIFWPQFKFDGAAFGLGVAGLMTGLGAFLPLMSWAHKLKQGTSAQ